jgi:hypothetical protein
MGGVSIVLGHAGSTSLYVAARVLRCRGGCAPRIEAGGVANINPTPPARIERQAEGLFFFATLGGHGCQLWDDQRN